jgi:hypothetical protein
MANITISDLRPAGSEFFLGSETYLSEIGDSEVDTINGGSTAICLATLSTYACATAISVATGMSQVNPTSPRAISDVITGWL